ncbi:UNVERIFIED_CONTAM: hypothetical protein Sindi_0069600 [Sesamum indicum]
MAVPGMPTMHLYMDDYGPRRLMGMEENPPITDVSPNHGGLPDWRWRNFFLWQDPWHHLGPVCDSFPRGPRLLGLDESSRLNTVIHEGVRQWPLITDLECLEITHVVPTILGGEDRIIWRFENGRPTTQAIYQLFDPPGPKVGWSPLLSGSLKIGTSHIYSMACHPRQAGYDR